MHELPAIGQMTRVCHPGLHVNTVTSSQDSGPAVARPCSRAMDARPASPWFQMLQLPAIKVPEVFPLEDLPSPMPGYAGQVAGIPEQGPKRQKLLPFPGHVVPEPVIKAPATGSFMGLLQYPEDTGLTFMPVNSAEAVSISAKAADSVRSRTGPTGLKPHGPEPTSPSSGASSDGSPLAIRQGCMDATGFVPVTPSSAALEPEALFTGGPDWDLEQALDVDVAAMMDLPSTDGLALPEAVADIITQGTLPFHHEPDSQARSTTPIRSLSPLRFYAHAAYTSTVPQEVPGRATPPFMLMVPAAFPLLEPADTTERSETTSSAQTHTHTVTSGIQGRANRALAYFTQNIGPNTVPALGSAAIPFTMAADERAIMVEAMPESWGNYRQAGIRVQEEAGKAGELPVDPLPEADSVVRLDCLVLSRNQGGAWCAR